MVWHKSGLEVRVYSCEEQYVAHYHEFANWLAEWFSETFKHTAPNEWDLAFNTHGLYYRCRLSYGIDKLDWSAPGPPKLVVDPAKRDMEEKLKQYGWKEGKGS